MSDDTWTCAKCGKVHPMNHVGIHEMDTIDGQLVVTASYCSSCSPLPPGVLDGVKG